MKKIAVINDLSGFGKCSLTAAIPIISSHKMQCCPLPTGVFSNQTGYESYKYVDLTASMQAFAEEWKKLDARFDAIITGFIPNSKQAEIISEFINDFKTEKTLVVVDPIMADNGEIYDGFDEKRIKAVCSLAEKADIVTPNISELCLLCGEGFENISGKNAIDKAEKMAKRLFEKQNSIVVVTGIEASADELANVIYDGSITSIIKSKKFGSSFSGTGDIFCSYLTCEYLNGRNIVDSVKSAVEFITKAAAKTMEGDKVSYTDGIDFELFL